MPMQTYTTNDGVVLAYHDTGVGEEAATSRPWLLLIHGFTGTSHVWRKNVSALAAHYRLIIPDLRGHGASQKPDHGFQVSRLAMDLRELVLLLQGTQEKGMEREWRAIGGSLGASILWCYASLFTTAPFTHTVFIDQSPLQNALPDWDAGYCSRGMNNPLAVAALQSTLATSPADAHKATIAACLAYRAYPLPSDFASAAAREAQTRDDEAFFLGEAMRGHQAYYGQLMADHTALDWRSSIAATFGPASGSQTQVLVVASSRSGCFPAAGPLEVVRLVGEKARGVVVAWGGHWCYWEDPGRFDDLVLRFLAGGVEERGGDSGFGSWVRG
ncbi:hypothetical protein QTJ16_004237 [Diplocarpon rosae]|uniref:AB hydrolase-1 domain-containing protein n=1 Tax=Diplocarpon rosae TaxID=946125 RepID=A0AAD9SYI2_9HELO|nr:hypothetical protein QTJ16_004237 [Diplocarpon rosae]PBP16932.1 hypothetical protein BUE80_DR012074 [Diplocarpon rosae]